MQYKDTPKIYVGTYHKYNCGSIAGKWLDLSEYSDIEELEQAMKELHKDEPDPEYMVQDFECFPESWYSESYDSRLYEKVIEYANLSDDDREIIEDYFDHASSYDSISSIDFQEILDNVIFTADPDDHDTIEEQFGYQKMEQSELPEWARGYFDYKSYGQDISYDCIVGEKYIFES